ncbi:SRPBCC family protein [Jatrophihabitans endophyticus]|uniref:SRPBCC family protein n=1 Tax=Jatrophihabitans endophyticus TaxID=1206085 RepID=UPI0019F26B04|nr:SRPBCC family protein [Jatrophihabitans endophyticus]MBE7187964.1 SRPBCC family protein [Jatrophihabitans endophyticus]
MITVERRVQTDSDLPAVFAYLSDFTHTEQWDPGTVRTTRTDDGPLRQGSTFHNVSTYRGRQTELDYRVVRLDDDEHLTFTGVNKTVEATDDMSFAAEDGHTVVTYRAHFAFKGWARLAEPFLRHGFERIADDTVIQLKRVLDALDTQS